MCDQYHIESYKHYFKEHYADRPYFKIKSIYRDWLDQQEDAIAYEVSKRCVRGVVDRLVKNGKIKKFTIETYEVVC